MVSQERHHVGKDFVEARILAKFQIDLGLDVKSHIILLARTASLCSRRCRQRKSRLPRCKWRVLHCLLWQTDLLAWGR